jgi:phage-related protein
MKINKKTIIILIVVAVAAWLLWKRKKLNESATVVESSSTTNRLEELIAGAGLTSMEAELVRNFKPTGAYKDHIISRALERGIDYESQLILSCLWNNYRNADNTAFLSDQAAQRYNTIYNKVLAMNK